MSKYDVNVDNLVGYAPHLHNYKGLRACQQRASLMGEEILCENIIDALVGSKEATLYIGKNVGKGNAIHILSADQHYVMLHVSSAVMSELRGGVVRTRIQPCDILQYCAVRPDHRAYAMICNDIFQLLLRLETKRKSVQLLRNTGRL